MNAFKELLADPAQAVADLVAREREPADIPDGYVSPLVGDPKAIQWFRARRALSFYAWDIYTGAAIAHYRAQKPAAPAPLLKSIGACVGELPPEAGARLEQEFLACKQVPWRDQRPDGYSFDPFANPWSTPAYRDTITAHREMSAGLEGALNVALTLIAPAVEAALGHYWSAGAARVYAHNAGHDGGMHTDGWPLGVRKIMFYPSGAGDDQGSTVLIIGEEPKIIRGGKGVWTVFENSLLRHMARAPLPGQPPRPTIEVTALPAFRNDPRIKGHGIHVGFPWLPPDIDGLEGDKVPAAFTSEAIKQRSALRALMLAADLPSDGKAPEGCGGLGYLDL